MKATLEVLPGQSDRTYRKTRVCRKRAHARKAVQCKTGQWAVGRVSAGHFHCNDKVARISYGQSDTCPRANNSFLDLQQYSSTYNSKTENRSSPTSVLSVYPQQIALQGPNIEEHVQYTHSLERPRMR